MTTTKERYTELLALTQLFVLREHSPQTVHLTDPSTHAFFQKWGSPSPLKKREALPATPIRAVTLPPDPPLRPPETPPLSPPPDPIPAPIKPDPVPPPTQPEPTQPPIVHHKPQQAEQTSSLKTRLEPLSFKLEPLPTSPVFDKRESWQLMQSLFPQLELREKIPSDALAQKMKKSWAHDQIIPPVILLSFHDQEPQLTFLKNLAQAISLRLAPARVLSAPKLEKEQQWETLFASPGLRLVITSDYELYLQPQLMRYYREVPQQGKHFLNQIPLLLLSDLTLYLKQPQLKALLWRAICNEFAVSHRHSPS